MEQALEKNFSVDALNGVTVGAKGLNSDMHGSAEYRAHLVNVMARRAVRRRSGARFTSVMAGLDPAILFGTHLPRIQQLKRIRSWTIPHMPNR